MQSNLVKQALKAGKLQLGMNFGRLRSPEIPRLLAAAGFHRAFIDTEPGGFDLETVQDICRAAQSAGICPVVRVVDLHYGLVARALDCGAQGIIFPRMEDPKLLETALSWTKFPPMGVAGDFQHPKMVEAMEAVRDTCERRGIAPGTHTRTIALARFRKERGMRFPGCGSDIGYLWEKASETAKAVLGQS